VQSVSITYTYILIDTDHAEQTVRKKRIPGFGDVFGDDEIWTDKWVGSVQAGVKKDVFLR
jgi:hypothetical protein